MSRRLRGISEIGPTPNCEPSLPDRGTMSTLSKVPTVPDV